MPIPKLKLGGVDGYPSDRDWPAGGPQGDTRFSIKMAFEEKVNAVGISSRVSPDGKVGGRALGILRLQGPKRVATFRVCLFGAPKVGRYGTLSEKKTR